MISKSLQTRAAALFQAHLNLDGLEAGQRGVLRVVGQGLVCVHRDRFIASYEGETPCLFNR